MLHYLMFHLNVKTKPYSYLFCTFFFINDLKPIWKSLFVCAIRQLHTHPWLDFIVVCFLRQIKIRCRRRVKIRLRQLRVRKDDPSPGFQGKQRKRIAARDRHLYRRKEKSTQDLDSSYKSLTEERERIKRIICEKTLKRINLARCLWIWLPPALWFRLSRGGVGWLSFCLPDRRTRAKLTVL